MGTLNLKTASGGSVILNPTNTASDVTITVPASNANMATDVSTLAQFNASGAAPVYACRAWVNFNGTGTVAIRASGNVSSITDLAVGSYIVNFTTAMPDANYSAVMSTQENRFIGIAYGLVANPLLAGSAQIWVTNSSTTQQDVPGNCVAIFR